MGFNLSKVTPRSHVLVPEGRYVAKLVSCKAGLSSDQRIDQLVLSWSFVGEVGLGVTDYMSLRGEVVDGEVVGPIQIAVDKLGTITGGKTLPDCSTTEWSSLATWVEANCAPQVMLSVTHERGNNGGGVQARVRQYASL